MSYTHITDFESISIEIYLNEKLNYSQIGRKLARHPSTIKREVERYRSKKTGIYHSKTAIKQRKLKRSLVNKQNKQRIQKDTFLVKYILSKIKRYRSPEQIS
jgi:IS30 family transposase